VAFIITTEIPFYGRHKDEYRVLSMKLALAFIVQTCSHSAQEQACAR